jgi:small subunit ribosomal protein S21
VQREGIFREMKLRGHYEKSSERRVRQKAEAIRRARKLARKKKLQREGLLPMKPRTIPGAGPGRSGPARRAASEREKSPTRRRPYSRQSKSVDIGDDDNAAKCVVCGQTMATQGSTDAPSLIATPSVCMRGH